MAKPVVGILMGSDSDLPVMQEAGAMLQEFGIEYEMSIASAHRTPKKVVEYTQTAEKRGLKVLIAGAGWAAHHTGSHSFQYSWEVGLWNPAPPHALLFHSSEC